MTTRASRQEKQPIRPNSACEGLETIAAIDTFIDALTVLRDRYLSDAAPAILGKFWDEVQETGAAPAKTKKVKEGRSVAVASLKRKTSSQPLKTSDIKALTEARIVLNPPQGSTLAINKKYLTDALVLKHLAELLDKTGKKSGVPLDFIEPADQKVTVTDDMVFDVLAIRDFQKVVALLPVIGSINIAKSEITGEDPISHAADVVMRCLPEVIRMASID
jgi:hypothetical protein